MCNLKPYQKLLSWYDRNARDLPWRIPPSKQKKSISPDPYKIWLSEIMLQQTTVAATKKYYESFIGRWPNVKSLADAKLSEVMGAWAGLGYYARARNLHKCAQLIVSRHGRKFPKSSKELLNLPGIGPYTSAAISAIAFDQPETVVDVNVERVVARFFNIRTPFPEAKAKVYKLAAKLTPSIRPGDYAQAVMDLGAMVCTPSKPACGLCPWNKFCAAHSTETTHLIPKKTPKKVKPTLLGIAYVVRRMDGAFLLERRPEKGLLGGMLCWPTTEWCHTPPSDFPPIAADWQILEGNVKHSFTHFNLILKVQMAHVSRGVQQQRGLFVPNSKFCISELPTLMLKISKFSGLG